MKRFFLIFTALSLLFSLTVVVVKKIKNKKAKNAA